MTVSIPKEIYELKGLRLCDKQLLAQVLYYCKQRGYCFAKNQHLAQLFQVSVRTIQRKIKLLKTMGLITRVRHHNVHEIHILSPHHNPCANKSEHDSMSGPLMSHCHASDPIMSRRSFQRNNSERKRESAPCHAHPSPSHTTFSGISPWNEDSLRAAEQCFQTMQHLFSGPRMS